MSNNSKIPEELYYLDEQFSVRSLRKYQLKQILAAHGIPYLSNITRQDLIVLFRKHIEARREEILRNYRTQELKNIEYGRGRRVTHVPKKYEDTVSDYLNMDNNVDADGFKIPTLPKKKINHEKPFFSSSSSSSTTTTTTLNNKKDVKISPKKPIIQDKLEEEEDSEDSDYTVDSSDFEEDLDDETLDEQDFGNIDKKELVQLYKDQFKPIESFIPTQPPEHTITTRSKTIANARRKIMIWHARIKRAFYIFCIIYMVISITGLGITTYARQKNGYCSSSIKPSTRTTTLFSLLPSSCIPCPDHGTCSNGNLVCDTLYEQKTPFYNIGHILPIADDCVHNSVLGKYVHSVEHKIKNYLSVHQGEAYCQHIFDNLNAKDVPITRIPVEKILNDLKPNFKQHLPSDKIDHILLVALSNVLEDSNIHYWETEDNKRYLGTDRMKLTFSCQIKRVYKSIPDKIKMYILLFISVITAIYSALKDYQKKKSHQQKIDKHLKLIVDQLKEQYDNHHQDSVQFPSPRILTSQLRSLIVDLNDQKTIADWQSVVEKSNTHPHIKKSIEEARGDIVEYWELSP